MNGSSAATLLTFYNEGIRISFPVFGVYTNYLHNNLYLDIHVPPCVFYKGLRDFLIKESEAGNINVSEACISDLHFSTLT